jgi:hypothetical protein
VMELARSSAAGRADRALDPLRAVEQRGDGLNGARAYVAQRRRCRAGRSARSGSYPEPKWLGMIQHDMMMWDHGMPRPTARSARSSGRKRTSTSSSRSTRSRDRSAEARVVVQVGRTRSTRPTTRQRRPAHDQHRLDAVHGLVRRSACARTNAARKQGQDGIRPGTTPLDVFSTFSDKDFRPRPERGADDAGRRGAVDGSSVKR